MEAVVTADSSPYGPGYCEDWNSSHGYPAPGEPPTYLCTSVPINIQSYRPCEVCLELFPGTNLADLKPDLTLTACYDHTTKLDKVAKFVSAAGGAPALLQIDLTQQTGANKGLYQAPVVDTNNFPRGCLTVCLW